MPNSVTAGRRRAAPPPLLPTPLRRRPPPATSLGTRRRQLPTPRPPLPPACSPEQQKPALRPTRPPPRAALRGRPETVRGRIGPCGGSLGKEMPRRGSARPITGAPGRKANPGGIPAGGIAPGKQDRACGPPRWRRRMPRSRWSRRGEHSHANPAVWTSLPSAPAALAAWRRHPRCGSAQRPWWARPATEFRPGTARGRGGKRRDLRGADKGSLPAPPLPDSP